MVIDNADSEEVIFGKTSEGSVSAVVGRHLPVSGTGSILITTRNKDVARGLVDNEADILTVTAMTKTEAVCLIQQKARALKVTDDHAARLAHHLDYMPLAISQAIAYVDQRSPRVTIESYAAELERSHDDQLRLLKISLRDSRRDLEASHSILLTWHVTYKHIRAAHPSAAELLALMCMFTRSQIPLALLKFPVLPEHEKMSHQTRPAQLDDEIVVLQTYDLITLQSETSMFSMHRLVQLSTQQWLVVNHELAFWQTKHIESLSAAFPWQVDERCFELELKDRPTYQSFVPHAKPILCIDLDTSQERAAFDLFTKIANFGMFITLHKLSEPFAKRAFSMSHTTVTTSFEMCAKTLMQILLFQRKYEDVKRLADDLLGLHHQRISSEMNPRGSSSLHLRRR